MPEATAQVSEVMHAAPDEVWKALTDAKLMKQYFMGADVESDWQVGHPIRFRGEMKGKPYEDKGEIRAVDAPRRLEFSHFSPSTGQPDTPESYHLVRFTLEPAQGETRVTLTQSNLTGGIKDSDRKMRAQFEKNWQGVLSGLKKVVERS